MSRSTITITPVDNISAYRVVDNKLVTEKTFDSYMDVFTFIGRNGKERKDTLINVSLYDDTIIIDYVKYKILRMLTK